MDIWQGKEEKIYPAKLLKTLSEHAPHVISFIFNSFVIVSLRIVIRCLGVFSLFTRLSS